VGTLLVSMVRDSAAPPAVVVDAVAKSFRIPREQVHTLKERAMHPLRRTTYRRFAALEEVSFAVQQGEFFGIVGRNGSGKSTLLKCLAGIYRVDRGDIYVNGRLSTFIELGVGFNPDLVARDNIMINAVMLGLNPRDARQRVERVLEFAELEDFTELKLKNYSSGMQVRLAFSVMVEVEADIHLIDEVLAVGDAAFQQKCFDVFHRFRDEGKTILLVTHDMGAVQRFCDRAMLLESGRMKIIGEPDHVANTYVELNFGRDLTTAAAEGPGDRLGDRSAEIVEAWLEGEDGERATSLPQGRPCLFRARVLFHQRIEEPLLGVVFENDRHHPLFAAGTEWAEVPTGTFEPGEEATFSVGFDNVFAPGRVFATPAVAHRGAGLKWIDRRERMTSVIVTGTRDPGGLVDLPHDIRLEREPARIPGGVPE
jgi:ABC-type polysaccharide/polyol phosphate transport system ATPase subunit